MHTPEQMHACWPWGPCKPEAESWFHQALVLCFSASQGRQQALLQTDPVPNTPAPRWDTKNWPILPTPSPAKLLVCSPLRDPPPSLSQQKTGGHQTPVRSQSRQQHGSGRQAIQHLRPTFFFTERYGLPSA